MGKEERHEVAGQRCQKSDPFQVEHEQRVYMGQAHADECRQAWQVERKQYASLGLDRNDAAETLVMTAKLLLLLLDRDITLLPTVVVTVTSSLYSFFFTFQPFVVKYLCLGVLITQNIGKKRI